MPLMKEHFTCPMTGEMKETEWMDETMDLCWRIMRNACMVPQCEADWKAMGCASKEDACKWINEMAKKVYNCFDEKTTFLMDKDRGAMSNTSLEEKNKFAAECYMAEGYLQKGLDTLKE